MDDRLVILLNDNVKMTPKKAAAQAVHAALMAYGVSHGAVVVLGARPGQIRDQCDILVCDAGWTELPSGTLTAGVRRGSDSQVRTGRSALGWLGALAAKVRTSSLAEDRREPSP
jgi:PTH2 family peptidyl-tRNA hydrolase